jgi:thiosulfate/3-mercaptopyruvate sulfurtransferase
VFFDIDAVADTSNPLPHMLPTADAFAKAVGALGIDEEQTIVVYDVVGLSSAPRVWWTFRIMGARDVVILEGGLAKWVAEKRPVEGGNVARPPRRFNARFKAETVRSLAEIRDAIGKGAMQVVDARPADRFRGEAPEPRDWVKSGHIPGSFSLPSTDIVADGKLKNPATIRRAFTEAGVDLDGPIVTSCGSGVNAAILTLALDTIGVGVEKTALYDGSWTEWGGRDDTEIAVGPARKLQG